MTELAKELSRHYIRKGNRIIFRSELTLNKASILIWEKLGYKDFDPSIFSKVLNSKRLLSSKQISAISYVLGLNEKETNKLQFALSRDILTEHSIDPENLFSNSILSFSQYLEYISLLRKIGKPESCIRLIDSILLNFRIREKNFLKTSKNNQLFLANLLLQKSRAIGETSVPTQVLTQTHDLNFQTHKIGLELKNQEILEMTYMNVGGCYYVASKWRLSSDYLMNNIRKVKRSKKLEFYRTLLLNSAYQNDFFEFMSLLKESYKFTNYTQKNENIIASYLEAIARSYSLFGKTNIARKILEKADCLNIDMFYKSQILRGKIFSIFMDKKNKKRINNDYIEIYKKEIKYTQFKNYRRHLHQNTKMLSFLTNE